MSDKLNIGGQAVLEGVMMRSPRAFTVAVRKGGKPGAEIALFKQSLQPLGERYPLLKKRIIRGTAALFEAMWLGMRALNFSANEALEEADGKKEEISPLAMAGTMILAIAFALGLFLALPLLLTNLLGTKYSAVGTSSLLFNLTDGAFRVVLFLGYVSGISFMKDIRRVFEYHGAEHKAIAAFEAGVAIDRGECPQLFEDSPTVRHQLSAHGCGPFHPALFAHTGQLADLGKRRLPPRPAAADCGTGIRVYKIQRKAVRQSGHQDTDAARALAPAAYNAGTV